MGPLLTHSPPSALHLFSPLPPYHFLLFLQPSKQIPASGLCPLCLPVLENSMCLRRSLHLGVSSDVPEALPVCRGPLLHSHSPAPVSDALLTLCGSSTVSFAAKPDTMLQLRKSPQKEERARTFLKELRQQPL